MSFDKRKLTILYGSQTGNAQDIAERIWRESYRFYYKSNVLSLDEYNVFNLIHEKCVIFICSTTGQGEEPDNMKSFWKFLLRKSLPRDSLDNLRFAVFGLGDSSYVKFNFVAKRLHKRLKQLGGHALLELGLGDDQHDLGYDANIDPWIEELWSKLLSIYPLPTSVQPLPRNLPICSRWSVQTKLLEDSKRILFQQSLYYSTRKSSDFSVTILENIRLTHQDHFQDVRLIKLKTNGEIYHPGDLVALRPRNLKWQVDEFLNTLKLNNVDIPLETVFTITENSSQAHVPEVLSKEVTFKQLVEEYFDLMAIPRRHVFQILSQLTDTELEKQKCIEFTTAEGQSDLYAYTNRPRRNIVEVLKDFPHATKNLTEEILFEIFPPIKPREFSIASNWKYHKNEIHILLAVVKYKTKLVKERYGLCSNYLADLKEGDEITAWVKKGSFQFPKDNSPVIMVGPGTGVAPFRNFIFERYAQSNSDKGVTVLIYGCRYHNKDFLCREEMEKLRDENILNLICAFSRDQDNKIYVQDKIIQHGEQLWKLIQNDAYIFIAGNAKGMPQSVREAFIDICIKFGCMSEDASTRFLQQMEKSGRYQLECWS